MSQTRVSEADEGKLVVTADGQELGLLAEVRDGTLYVDADQGLLEKMKVEFHVGDPVADAYALETAEVAAVTDDEVRLE